MGHQGHASRQELGTRGLDVDLPAVGRSERNPVIRTGLLSVLDLGLRDGGAERDVPERGRFGEVGVPGTQVLEEGALRYRARGVVDGPVGQVPVDGESQGAEQVLEDLLVLHRELFAQLDEVAS